MSNVADVVVSNCVMNLVPNKPKAFAEVQRILKPTGHFSISDIVLVGDLPEKLKCQRNVRWLCSIGHSNGRLFENYRKFWFQKHYFTEEKTDYRSR